MAELKAQLKVSGDHRYYKVEGDHQTLCKMANKAKVPVKPASGSNPEHVDLPEKRFTWVSFFFTACVVVACVATYFIHIH